MPASSEPQKTCCRSAPGRSRRPEALDQRRGAALTFVGAEPGIVQQVAREHTLHHLKHRSCELRLRSQ